jgi:hypothetical protein
MPCVAPLGVAGRGLAMHCKAWHGVARHSKDKSSLPNRDDDFLPLHNFAGSCTFSALGQEGRSGSKWKPRTPLVSPSLSPGIL